VEEIINALTPTDVFKALSDENRLKSLLLISQYGELCVCELMVALDVSQPKISRHLAILRNTGILLDRRQGKWVYYRVNPNLPQWISNTLEITAKENSGFLEQNHTALKRMPSPSGTSSCC
jgi:ArsR family transcriptional regulator